MATEQVAAGPISMEPLPYHLAVRDFLKRSDAEVWKWFASQRRSPKLADDVRFDLLKSTYRVERDSHPEIYAVTDEVKSRFDIDAALTVYQAQNPEGLNASLAYVPSELHLIFQGPVATRLSPEEFRAVIAHEFAHYQFWQCRDGEMLISSDMLQALVTDRHAYPTHFATWRLFRLYTEIYCDRAALAVTQDLGQVVSLLVKIHTGLTEVSPEAFMRQADEVFSRAQTKAEGLTHPEAYIRARALRLWSEQHPECDILIAGMIEGRPGLDEIDLLEQQRLSSFTRRLLDALLCRKWFQTDPVLAHLRLFFDNYQPPAETVMDAALPEQLRKEPESVGDYYCYVLLDFSSIDGDLDEAPLAAALTLADGLQIKPRFLELARKELKLKKNQLDKIDRSREQILADADRTAATP